MARSTYVYVVEHIPAVDLHEVVAGFTVKHELREWLKDQAPESLKDLTITRVPDGGRRPGLNSVMNVDDLLSGS